MVSIFGSLFGRKKEEKEDEEIEEISYEEYKKILYETKTFEELDAEIKELKREITELYFPTGLKPKGYYHEISLKRSRLNVLKEVYIMKESNELSLKELEKKIGLCEEFEYKVNHLSDFPNLAIIEANDYFGFRAMVDDNNKKLEYYKFRYAERKRKELGDEEN